MSFFINTNECNLCGNCLEVCMNNAILNFYDFYLINPYWCAECGSCSAMCYNDAIGYSGLGLSPSNEENTLKVVEFTDEDRLFVL